MGDLAPPLLGFCFKPVFRAEPFEVGEIVDVACDQHQIVYGSNGCDLRIWIGWLLADLAQTGTLLGLLLCRTLIKSDDRKRREDAMKEIILDLRSAFARRQ
jgi:hypothetical protein